MKDPTGFPALLQAFFTDRLMKQQRASPHTIASYRDTFRQLLRFATTELKKPPSTLLLDDLDACFIGSFLNHIENVAGIGTRSRNQRLAAIRSFFKYAAYQAPGQAELIQRVLAIPNKRQERALVEFLTRPEVDAILRAPDQSTWAGRRDHVLLLVAVRTGLRVAELTRLSCDNVVLGTGAHLRCFGKGRKERCTPLAKEAAKALGAWLRERSGRPSDPIFPNARGGVLSPDGVQYILNKHVTAARQRCLTLRKKRISPHVLRHTMAMDLLCSGVDRSVIALWLGHESEETTQMYLNANLALKEEALAKTASLNSPTKRYKPDDKLLAFLTSL